MTYRANYLLTATGELIFKYNILILFDIITNRHNNEGVISSVLFLKQ